MLVGAARTELSHLLLELGSTVEDDFGNISRRRVLLLYASNERGSVLAYGLVRGLRGSEERGARGRAAARRLLLLVRVTNRVPRAREGQLLLLPNVDQIDTRMKIVCR